jgi:hypothetical protein
MVRTALSRRATTAALSGPAESTGFLAFPFF